MNIIKFIRKLFGCKHRTILTTTTIEADKDGFFYKLWYCSLCGTIMEEAKSIEKF